MPMVTLMFVKIVIFWSLLMTSEVNNILVGSLDSSKTIPLNLSKSLVHTVSIELLEIKIFFPGIFYAVDRNVTTRFKNFFGF